MGHKRVGNRMARKPDGQKGFLARLLSNQAGNVLFMTAAFLIPLLGLVGGGVDMSRLYLAKTSLQQACDAGALAGRKQMGIGAWTTGTGSTTEARALNIFNANFKSGDFGTSSVAPTYTESNGTVTGAATVTMPMMVIRVLGITSKTINVACTAKMEIPNTDVMFVLDNTGSMNCQVAHSGYTCPGGSNNNVEDASAKMVGLRSAINCFYEALMKVNTNEPCTYDSATSTWTSTGDPTATTYTGTAQIRFGFMPYSVNVNVGKLLPQSYIADTWPYQSRVSYRYNETITSGPTTVQETSNSYNNKTQCQNWASGTTVTGFPTTAPPPSSFSTTTVVNSFVSWTSGTKTCKRDVTTTARDYVQNSSGTYNIWVYKQITHNVSALKGSGGTWNNSVNLPVGSLNANAIVGWDGCIEERQTYQNTNASTITTTDWNPIPASAYDTDFNLVPSSTAGTQWGPMLREAVWARYTGSGDTTADVVTTTDLSRNYSYSCPTEARTLQTWTPANLETYVDSLVATGNTYHDIGMVWGARFISPTGIFATQNTNVQPIQRHIVFMTDGDTVTTTSNYSAYGVTWWDRRQTSYAPASNDTNNIVNSRLTALCAAIRNQNITLWVISYGGGVNSTTETRLQNCASTPNTPNAANSHFFTSSSTSSLMTAFQQIAASISDLRLIS